MMVTFITDLKETTVYNRRRFSYRMLSQIISKSKKAARGVWRQYLTVKLVYVYGSVNSRCAHASPG